MSVLNNSNAIEDASYKIQRSLRFRSSASAYLSRTFGAPTSTTKCTVSFWYKRGLVGSSVISTLYGTVSTSTGVGTYIQFNTDSIRVNDGNTDCTTTAVYRDPSAWYHIVVAFDTTQATAANRMLLYVNGVQVTSFSSAAYGAQNYTLPFTAAGSQYIGYSQPSNVRGSDGYQTEVNFIDGQALTPSSFGQTDAVTGVWTPKKYTGTYGTNGFYLPFSDNTSATTLAYDKSGNGNNWTPNNISTTAGSTYDSMLDVPTLTSATAANYCVLNPLQTTQSATSPTNGNLTSPANSGVWRRIGATMQMPPSGKFYFEYTCDSFASFPTFSIGVFSGSIDTTNNAIGYSATEWGYNGQSGYATNNNTNITSGFTTATTGDVLQLAYDASTGSIWFGKNNVWQGASSPNPATGTSPTYTGVYNIIPVMVQNWAAQSANFGQRPFSYTPPTGFKALNTFNLPDPTIKKPNQYMDATTYTGNGTYPRSITNAAGFQPDLVWTKARSTTYSHVLYDSVRGTGVYKDLSSDLTSAEGTNGGIYCNLTSFDAGGWTIGSTSSTNILNNNGTTFVGWQWKKGATPGFDIVIYTGTGVAQNISHNLGVAPKMIIVKARNTTGDWQIYTSTTGQGNYLLLNSTAASAASSTKWNNTAPTSSVFSVGIDTTTNMATTTYVAYLFAEIAGFSKFGSYTGNGSADGPFTYTGFRPKYIMVKASSTGGVGYNWVLYDTSRSPYNVADLQLAANLSDAEAVSNQVDILSNGFKVFGGGTRMNGSGTTYIYAAFAENPFKYSLAR